jgi:glycosyltransferase involved in cell wall biosynthesis
MKELWLFTTRFPYGLREAFLENELPVLCAHFDRVVIFPEHRDPMVRSLPANAEIRTLVGDPYAAASVGQLLLRPRLVWSLLRSLWRDAPSYRAWRRQWPELRSRIAQLIHRAACLEAEWSRQEHPETITLYAYWTHDWATVLGLIRMRHPAMQFFSRGHGFDVFEEQNRDHWIPFRSFQLRHLSRVYCASRTGMEHLQASHPAHRDLFVLSRLGTRDHGPGPLPQEGPLHVVSCSFLIPRKRVMLLVQALALVKRPVRWTHFGSGEEEQSVRAAVAASIPHVQVDLRGMTPNHEIMQWYKSEPVDVFVHLSRLEGGVAVAVQEAMSFGIPVIAADSGGVREIMTPQAGVLLGKDPRADQVAALLEGWREGAMGTPAFRSGVRATWRSGFEAIEVFTRFVEDISADASGRA